MFALRPSYRGLWNRPCVLPFEALGQPPRMRRLRRGMLTLAGLFKRQIREVHYQFEQPFVMDTSKFERVFGGSVTPLRGAFDKPLPRCNQAADRVPPVTPSSARSSEGRGGRTHARSSHHRKLAWCRLGVDATGTSWIRHRSGPRRRSPRCRPRQHSGIAAPAA